MSRSVLCNFIFRSLSTLPKTTVSNKLLINRPKSNLRLFDDVIKLTLSSSSKSRLVSLSASPSNKSQSNSGKDGESRGTKFERTKNNLRETKRLMKVRIEEMKENVYTVPNLLCLIRIGLTPPLGYFVVNEWFLTSLSIFVVAGATDLADGFIARRYPSQRSKFGSFLDPFADKLLVATLFATLTWIDLIPLLLTALIVTRDVILVSAGLIIRYKSLPEPRTVGKFFDVTMATADLSPTLISKLNTTLQLFLVGTSLAAPVFDFVSHPYLTYLFYATGTMTVLSGLSYIVTRGTYKFVRGSIRNKKGS